MTDIVDAATRSRMMSGIRSRNTKPEIQVRRLLHHQGFRFRLHVRELPGKPDIVLPRYHAVIFVHGCFWHGHYCRLCKIPATRETFWREKITRNRTHDHNVQEALLAQGWRIGIVWECALRSADKKMEALALRLGEWLHSKENLIEIQETKNEKA